MKHTPAARAEFIQAKILPPPGPATIVRNKTLTIELTRSDSIRVVMVQAPAGYGKTTWMVAQCQALRAEGMPAIWLTLDPGDDRETLVKYLGAAVMLGSGSPEPDNHKAVTGISGGLPGLLLALRKLRVPLTIFIDELEALADSAAFIELDNLIENLPLRHTLVLASRKKPDLRLARYRVRGEVLDIGAKALEFDREGIYELLRAAGANWIDDDAVRAILAGTEGWPMAVELASKYMRERDDIGKLIVDGGVTLPNLHDYLAEEILARQDQAVQDFLLDTSILRDLHPGLCDVLLDRDDSRQMIALLQDSNLFLTRSDSTEWVRFHSLFRGMLRRVLARTGGRDIKRLHQRAALALADMELFNLAIDHAIAGNDDAFVEDFIAGPGQLAIQRGAAARIAAWADTQPLKRLSERQDVLVVTAWAHLLVRDVVRANAELDVLTQYRETDSLGEPERRSLAMLETMFAMMTGDFSSGLAMSQQYLDDVASSKSFERGVICNVSGYAEILLSRFDDAEAHLAEGTANHACVGSTFGAAFSVAYRGLLEAVQGRLNAALQIYAQARDIESDAELSPSRAVVDGFAADILLEQNRLVEAREKIRFSLSCASEFAYCGIVNLSPVTMTRLLAADEGTGSALRFVDNAIEDGMRRAFPRLVMNLQWERVRLHLLREDIVEARRLADRIPAVTTVADADRTPFYPDELEATDLGAIRLLLHEGSCDEALALIEPAIKRADATRRGWRASKLRVMRCLALDRRGDTRVAMRRLLELVEATANERFTRLFLDEGAMAVVLIERLHEQLEGSSRAQTAESSLSRLRAILDYAPHARTGGASPERLENLTRREAAIVSCLGEGLTNKQIASRLFLSENTVKWNLRNIYQKLGVRNRTGVMAALSGAGPAVM